MMVSRKGFREKPESERLDPADSNDQAQSADVHQHAFQERAVIGYRAFPTQRRSP